MLNHIWHVESIRFDIPPLDFNERSSSFIESTRLYVFRSEFRHL
nr:MAG TPA: hypothetical protein [Caudoviricetes sp.]